MKDVLKLLNYLLTGDKLVSYKRMNLWGTLKIVLNVQICTFVLLHNKFYSLKRNCDEKLQNSWDYFHLFIFSQDFLERNHIFGQLLELFILCCFNVYCIQLWFHSSCAFFTKRIKLIAKPKHYGHFLWRKISIFTLFSTNNLL